MLYIVVAMAVIVILLYFRMDRGGSDAWKLRVERYRARRRMAPRQPIDPTFQFDPPSTVEEQDRPPAPNDRPQ
jgi:hypothetical protein